MIKKQQSPDWTVKDWLKYIVARINAIFHSRIPWLIVVLAAVVGGAWLTYRHLQEVQTYLSTSVPKVLSGVVEKGTTIERVIRPRSVSFYSLTSHGPHFLATYPRGMGLAHITITRDAVYFVMNHLYPWFFVLVGALIIIALVRDAMRERLFPSATKVMHGFDRDSKDILAKNIPKLLNAYKIFDITEDYRGKRLSDFCRLEGGDNYGAELEIKIGLLNRFRRQRPWGSVVDENTKLRPGWKIIVPKSFSEPTTYYRGGPDGTRVTLEREKVIMGGEEAEQITAKILRMPPPESPDDTYSYDHPVYQSAEEQADYEPADYESSENHFVSSSIGFDNGKSGLKVGTPSNGESFEGHGITPPIMPNIHGVQGPTNDSEPIIALHFDPPTPLPSGDLPLGVIPSPGILDSFKERLALAPAVHMSRPPRIDFRLRESSIANIRDLEQLDTLFGSPSRVDRSDELLEAFVRPVTDICNQPALCTPSEALAVHTALPGVIASVMARMHANGAIRSIPRIWRSEVPAILDSPESLIDAVLAHDRTIVESPNRQLIEPVLSVKERSRLEAVANDAYQGDPIDQVCKFLPAGLPLVAIRAISSDEALCVFSRPVTMNSYSLGGWTFYHDIFKPPLAGSIRAGKLWVIEVQRLPAKTSSSYNAIRVSEENRMAQALVINGGDLAVKGQLGKAVLWSQHFNMLASDAHYDPDSLVTLDDDGLHIDLDETLDILVVRIAGHLRYRKTASLNDLCGLLGVLHLPASELNSARIMNEINFAESEVMNDETSKYQLTPLEHSVLAMMAACGGSVTTEKLLEAFGATRDTQRSVAMVSRERGRRNRARKRIEHLLQTLSFYGASPQPTKIEGNKSSHVYLGNVATELSLDILPGTSSALCINEADDSDSMESSLLEEARFTLEHS